MKLHDRAFYAPKAKKQASTETFRRWLTAEELFDVIMREAQAGASISDKVEQLKSLGLSDQQVEQVIKITGDGNQPDGTGANGQYAPLSQPEIPGTGKIAQQDWDEVEKKLQEPEPLESQEPKLEEPEPLESQGPKLEELKQKSSPEEEEKRKDVKELMEGKDIEEKKRIILSFLGWLSTLHEKWKVLFQESQERGLPKAEKLYLNRELHKMQVQISKAGNLYKRLLRLMQPTPAKPARGKPGEPGYRPAVPEQPGIPETEAVKWLQEQMQLMKRNRSSMVHLLQDEDHAAIDSGQTNKVQNLKASSALPSTSLMARKQVGQMSKPQPTGDYPGDMPASEAPEMKHDQGVGMEPNLVGEDDRSLQELLEEIERAFDALRGKVESGETILDGKEIEPVDTDSGATPAPAPTVADKEAVDQSAKDYYRDYYGPYGNAMTKDRVAGIVDTIDEVAAAYQVKLTSDQVNKIAEVVYNLPNQLPVEDLIVVDYIVKTSAYKASALNPALAPSLKNVALMMLPDNLRVKYDAYIKSADSKIDKPKVNHQMDDYVKIDRLEDKADKDEYMLARPAHLRMKVDDQEVDGAYLKLTIKWDADDEAAARSDEGIAHAVLSFVKGLESRKEPTDYGWMGKPEIIELDTEGGLAVVQVRTKKPGDAPSHVKTTPKKAQSVSRKIWRPI